MGIAFKLQQFIQDKKVSQEALASELGVSQSAIHNIISGKTKKIDFYFICKIAAYFEVDVNHFNISKSILENPSKLTEAKVITGVEYLKFKDSLSQLKEQLDRIEKKLPPEG
jgi:transcriptional regulator with XRE-family HTH domain